MPNMINCSDFSANGSWSFNSNVARMDTGGINGGACAKMSVPAGSSGWMYAYVFLKPGDTYTLNITAKSRNVQSIRIQVARSAPSDSYTYITPDVSDQFVTYTRNLTVPRQCGHELCLKFRPMQKGTNTDGSEEGIRVLGVSGCDPTPLFEHQECVFDQMAQFV